MFHNIKQLINKDKKEHLFSYSQLDTYKTCPQQYKIIYLDGIRKQNESVEAFMGKMVHETLEWLYNIENREKTYITFDSLCQKYDELWIKNWHDKIFIANSYGIIIIQLGNVVYQIIIAYMAPLLNSQLPIQS